MIDGKVVVITGASSGIGQATASFLARRGAKVVLGARNEHELARVTDEITSAGGHAVYRVTDVSRRDDLLHLVTLAQERFGRLDVLFSNAGAMSTGPLDDLAVDDWEQLVDVNLKGVLFGIAAALPVFRKQGSGHFIHMASTAARKTVPNQAVYSATKAAVLALSDGLRQELAGHIRVSVLTPGATNTQEKIREAFGDRAMSPEAVASAVAYILDQPAEVNIGEIIIRSLAQP